MDRFKITRRVGTLGILGNIFLLIIKVAVGFVAKSQSMIADAANSAGDIFASAMTAIGNKISSAPKDDTHNFGHGKAEYIFSLLISISMIGISLKIVFDSVLSIINKNEVVFSWWLIIVCALTICTKLLLFVYCKFAYKKCKNILIEANMEDHRNDCIITTFTTISIILSKFGIYWFDGIVGIGISSWILYTGIRIFIESYNILMDKSMDKDTKQKIIEKLKGYKEIVNIEEIYTLPIGYRYMVVLTIDMDGNLDTFKTHEIADKIEKDLVKSFEEIDKVLVHVEPVKMKE